MKSDRQTAKSNGDAHYIGMICEKHPNLGGERLVSNGRCIKCCQNSAKEQRAKLKYNAIFNYSSGLMRCERCGEKDIDVLTIDHIDQRGNEHRKANGISGKYGTAIKGERSTLLSRWLKQNNYPPGFRVLCFNCNIKVWLLHNRGENE